MFILRGCFPRYYIYKIDIRTSRTLTGKWIYCTFKINIKVSFTKGLAIQQCTRGKLYIWNEFVTKKANMDTFKGCVSLPLSYACRQSFL